MISVVPLGWRSRPSTVSCLEKRAETAVVFEAALFAGRVALAGFPVFGADRPAWDFEGFDVALLSGRPSGLHRFNGSILCCH
jgi:hypothetical protein